MNGPAPAAISRINGFLVWHPTSPKLRIPTCPCHRLPAKESSEIVETGFDSRGAVNLEPNRPLPRAHRRQKVRPNAFSTWL